MKLARSILILFCALTGACSFSYYAQSVSGQAELFRKQLSVQDIIADSATDPQLRQKLAAIEAILEYAYSELALPDNGSYRHYKDLKRDYVVWNIFAAPEFSLQPKQWCYLVVGCVNYRGYFHEQQALATARRLSDRGWEVAVGGVLAYSTLGWFEDPLLNTMLKLETWEIARLLFHELAHQRLYIQHATDFNEAFADAIAEIGLRGWLLTQPPDIRQSAQITLERQEEFISLALAARDRFASLYQSSLSEQDMRTEKSRLLEQLNTDYRDLSSGWGDDTRYDLWINSEINNARLSALSTYRTLVPDFLAAYKQHGSSLTLFYEWIEKLSDCAENERLYYLHQPELLPSCQP